MILGDLAKAYGIQVDNFVLSGTGTGQPRGILGVTGINTVAFTSTAPRLAGSTTIADNLYPKLANLISQIQTSRYDVPTAWVMSPSRWYWMVAQSDNSGRPLVVPRDHGPNNAITAGGDTNVAQGVVGDLLGIPVVIDPNVPQNLGGAAPANIQDVIVLAKWDDLFLWEGQVRAQAFEQTYANQLSLFLRLYNYMSFQPGRYPRSIGTITGTGLVTPAF
jgi:HK97 family phage major capsid protein